MFKHLLIRLTLVAVCAVGVFGSAARAEVISHGTTSLYMEFVTVGNPGNADDPCPNNTFYGSVDTIYRIGKYEVTRNQWDKVVGADTTDKLTTPGYWSDDQPVAAISWTDAAKFCNWLTSGNVKQGVYGINSSGGFTGVIDRASAEAAYGTIYFLPTLDEWYKAAYYDPDLEDGGGGYWDYPTQHDSSNPSKPDGIDYAGDGYEAVFNDGHNQGHPNPVSDTGLPSAYGTMGQGGNVWEWTESGPWANCFYSCGGGYSGPRAELHNTYSNQNHGPVDTVALTFGFRVASNVPEPGSLALLASLALMGLAFLLRRR